MKAAFDEAARSAYRRVMRNIVSLAACAACLILVAEPIVAAPDPTPEAGSQIPSFPHGPTGPLDLGQTPPRSRPAFGPGGALDQPSSSGRPAAAAPPPEAHPKPTRAEMLDKLLGRLAKASDPGEAKGIAGLVQQIWMHSGSDTADLLMSRAMAAMNGNRHDVAEALLGQILELQPDWAEAWNKRATLRFLDNDDRGSMEDIAHVLTLEPRHFGALSGMGFILERHGEDKAALKALRRALDVYPQDADVRKAVDKLSPEVEGKEL